MRLRTAPQVVLPRGERAQGPVAVRSDRTGFWTPIGLVALAFVLALMLGAGAATGQKLIIIGLLGVVGGLAVLAVPVTWTFWTMIVMSLVVVGPATYFLRLSQLQWLPALLGAVLYVQALVILIVRSTKSTGAGAGMPGFAYMLALFWLTAAFSSVLGRVSLTEALMGSRYYVLVWGALMVFFVGAVSPATIDRVWKALLLFATFQFPMAAYQYLFVAQKRATGEIQSTGAPPWDAVIGTFPGTDIGGGNSAAMGFFGLSMLLLAVALWREKRLSAGRALTVVLCALGSIALAEVKAIVLLIPVALGLLYRRELARHPAHALAALVGGVLIAGLLLWGYQKIHYETRVIDPKAELANATVLDRLARAINPPDYEGSGDALNRVGNLARWRDQQAATSDIYRTLFGHGIGTTQYSNLEVGRLVRRFGPDIGRTSLVILLWETGIVGTLVFACLLGSGAWLSARLARDARIPDQHRLFLRVGALLLFLLLLTLPYKNYAVRLTGIQLLMILMLGQAFYWWRFTRPAGAAVPGSPPASA